MTFSFHIFSNGPRQDVARNSGADFVVTVSDENLFGDHSMGADWGNPTHAEKPARSSVLSAATGIQCFTNAEVLVIYTSTSIRDWDQSSLSVTVLSLVTDVCVALFRFSLKCGEAIISLRLESSNAQSNAVFLFAG